MPIKSAEETVKKKLLKKPTIKINLLLDIIVLIIVSNKSITLTLHSDVFLVHSVH